MSEQVDKASALTVEHCAKYIGVFALSGSCLSLCAEWLWIGSLLNHLSAHVVLCLLCCVPIVAKFKLPSALLITALILFALPWVYQAYEQRAPVLSDDNAISGTFLTANTAWWNRREHKTVAQELAATGVDFCAVIEAHPSLSESLRDTKVWPHVRGSTRLGPYSILVLSKFEILEDRMHIIKGVKRDLKIDGDEKPVSLADSDMIIFELLIKIKEKHIKVIVAHPPSPLFPALLGDRSKVLQKIADLTKASTEPCVLLGDFNAVPASYEWRQLHRIGLLRPHGRQMRTWMWPGLQSLRQFLGLAIDYIAVSPQCRMSPLRYVNITGSDHLAIAADIQFTE